MEIRDATDVKSALRSQRESGDLCEPENYGRKLGLFPLTPAFSLGEREYPPPVFGESKGADGRTTLGKLQRARMLFPLPKGEGQGEGEETS